MLPSAPQSHGLKPCGLSRIAKVRALGSAGWTLKDVGSVAAGTSPPCCNSICVSSAGLGYLMVLRAVPPLFSMRLETSSGLAMYTARYQTFVLRDRFSTVVELIVASWNVELNMPAEKSTNSAANAIIRTQLTSRKPVLRRRSAKKYAMTTKV